MDYDDADKLQEILVSNITPSANHVLDCTDVDYICDEGIRALLVADRVSKARHAVYTIRGMNKNILNKLDTLGFMHKLSIEPAPDSQL